MKAIVTPQAGAQGSLVLTDVPVPETDAGEVLVRVRAVGVGVHDRWFMPHDARFPYPIGIEAAGTIEEAGAVVTRFRPGNRVTVFMAGASGAIGTLAIQLAKRRGGRVAASASARNHE